MRFRLADGRLLRVPCNRSTCAWCSRRTAMVTAMMVGLDAEAEQPRIVSTFTTRDPVGPEELRRATAYILKLVRSEIGPARYCGFLEFTTGEAARSGGVRRPHVHTLWKDVGPEAAPVIAGCAGHVLERAAGAWRHDVEEVRSPAGATMYVARHHLKESQAPPVSWGPTRRVRPSRGYWSRPAGDLRRQGAALVRERRIERRLWRELEDRERDGQRISEDVWEECVLGPALESPSPEVVKVREHRGQLVEVLGPVR